MTFATTTILIRIPTDQQPSTPDEKHLATFIHRETLAEAHLPRRGNQRYTTRAWFASPA